jgi:hypothetical protein
LARTTTAAAATTTTTTTTINFEVYTLTFHGDRPKTTSGECSPASSELNIQSRACQTFTIVWGSFASLSQEAALRPLALPHVNAHRFRGEPGLASAPLKRHRGEPGQSTGTVGLSKFASLA